jgi:arabinose-5-phosphate isomerase
MKADKAKSAKGQVAKGQVATGQVAKGQVAKEQVAKEQAAATGENVVRIEAEALRQMADRLAGPMAAEFDRAVAMLHSCTGRVVVTGMGKSGLVARKVAATLSSTGTPSLFLHPAEAVHGDLGMVARGDTVVALSGSGETEELLRLLATLKRLQIGLVALTGDMGSTLARAAEVALDCSIPREACSLGLAPTASTTAMMALGDALALALAQKKGFKEEDFANLHPGGKLGKRLARVGQLMHTGDAVPRVSPGARMPDVIYEMSRKKLGMTAVVEGERVVGILSDGDLRRLLEKRGKDVMDLTAGECMTRDPKTIAAGEFAAAALSLMEQRKITSLAVVDGEGKLEGVVHLHDLWGTQMV